MGKIKNWKIESRICDVCGEEFMANISMGQRRCSSYCNQKAWVMNNPERARQLGRIKSRRRYFSVWGYYSSVKNRAKKQGIIFDLTSQEFKEWYERQSSKCSYCQSSLERRGAINLKSESIDRIDSQSGYVKGNLALSCRRCNSIKGCWFTGEEMLEIASRYLTNRPYYLDSAAEERVSLRERTCPICNKTFTLTSTEVNTKIYCSPECARNGDILRYRRYYQKLRDTPIKMRNRPQGRPTG